MAQRRLPMRKIREILRLVWLLGFSLRRTAESLGLSPSTVSKTVSRAELAQLDWEKTQQLDDEALEIKVYGPKVKAGTQRPEPDPVWIHTQLKRKGVTLELLHLEYLEADPDGYRYTAFCDRYRAWKKKQKLAMRQTYKAGEKLFVDYSGDGPEIVDAVTGEVIGVELFVAALGASNYTYADATRTQQGPDWIASHVRAFEYYGGVTELVVSDQLGAGVAKPCRYEPVVQRTYDELATHYGTALLPARPRKPKDKAKVESAVLQAQRWILARLRNQTFFSLADLNARIRELLDELNARPMKTYGGASRRDLFERFDRGALKPLAAHRFTYGEWKNAKVNIDYHVELDKHYYSVPYGLRGDPVELRYTTATVEILHKGKRVASHRRSYEQGRHTTVAEHMPKAHRAHLEWSPSRLIGWGEKIGPETGKLVRDILESRPHPEQGYRSCLGLLRLAKRYDDDRLEAACGRARRRGARSYRHVASILKHNLDKLPPESASSQPRPPIVHDNLRGPDYYQKEEPINAH